MIMIIKFHDALSEKHICSAIIKSEISNDEVKNTLQDAFVSFFEYAAFNDKDPLVNAVKIVLNSFIKTGEFDSVYVLDNNLSEGIDIYL